MYFRETELVYVYGGGDEGSEVAIRIDSPLCKAESEKDKVIVLENTGSTIRTLTKADERKHIVRSIMPHCVTTTDLLKNITVKFNCPSSTDTIRDFFLLNDLTKSMLLLMNSSRYSSFNQKSIIIESKETEVREIYKSRYLLDKLLFVDQARSILCATQLYEGSTYHSIVVLINYQNGSVFQRFPTNFTRLNLSPDLNYACDLKRTGGKEIKVGIRRLWSKSMIITHLLMQNRVPQIYGESIVRRVIGLLDDTSDLWYNAYNFWV